MWQFFVLIKVNKLIFYTLSKWTHGILSIIGIGVITFHIHMCQWKGIMLNAEWIEWTLSWNQLIIYSWNSLMRSHCDLSSVWNLVPSYLYKSLSIWFKFDGMHAANWLLTRSIFLKQFIFLLNKDKYYIGIVYRIYRMAVYW